MDVQKLAIIIISGVDSTHSVFSKVSNNVKNLSSDMAKIWKTDKFSAIQKGFGVVGNSAGVAAGVLGAFAPIGTNLTF